MVSGLMLLAAACGSDDESSSDTQAPVTTTAAGATTTSSGGSETTVGGTDTTAATGSSEAPSTTAGSGASVPAGSAGCEGVDTSLDADNGTGAGRFKSDLECADSSPLKAEGEPITIGYQTAEGDPNGSFPEFAFAAEAAAEYINNELGGLGADIQNGVPGRPIDLQVCKMAISPDDSQRCANELIAKDPVLVFSAINFFGNHFPIYAASQTPVVVITPISIADFTSPGVFAIGTGGGCLGAHTALAKFAAINLEGKKIGIPWADTPPGVTCYYDLEAKPLDVLNGKVQGTSDLAGSIPDLTYLGVPIKPATADVTPLATQVLDFDPDVIMFSGQSADCWNLVSGLGRLGWTPKEIPMVMSGSCIDYDAMAEAGELSVGAYFVGSSGSVLNDPATLDDPYAKFEATIYQSKPEQYGMPADQLKKGFATQGFASVMALWELSGQVVAAGGELTSDTLEAAFADTAGQHLLASPPLSCSTAPTPYIAVCNAQTAISQWDGTQLVPVEPVFNGTDLIAGTEIKTGP